MKVGNWLPTILRDTQRVELQIPGVTWTVRRRFGHEIISFLTFRHIVRTLGDAPNTLLFFDQSTFLFEVNPRRIWLSRANRAIYVSSTNFKRYHLLLLVNLDGAVAWQFYTGRSNSLVLCRFLLSSLISLRQAHLLTRFQLVLDNATLHKTISFKRLAVLQGP